MSRIGNNPIIIPDGVSVIQDKYFIHVKGKLGELSQEINSLFKPTLAHHFGSSIRLPFTPMKIAPLYLSGFILSLNIFKSL